MSTLFLIDYEGNKKGVIQPIIREENLWVFDEGVRATRKFDGTAAAIINGELYKRYDAKNGKQPPPGAISCQEPDEITGHWPHWVKCDPSNPADKYFFSVDITHRPDGTYELCGEKIKNNPERVDGHQLIKHGSIEFPGVVPTFAFIKNFFFDRDIEGLVFHHPDGRMCKIRKSDFGFSRDY